MTDETENEPWTPDQTEIEQIIRDHELWLLEDIRTGDDSRRANFRSANLNGRGIKSANLSEADLSAANLTNCEFQKTILHNANFLKSNLAESHFWDTSIRDAYLYGTDLSGVRFWDTDLENATLREAKIDGIDIRRSNFRNADLQGLNFDHEGHEVDFEDTILRDANLKNAKLETVLGLQSHQLGGADLSNAKVPSHIDEFEGIGQVEELSKHARNIFLSVVGGCVFSWLTIATTTDIALITNATSGGTKLPVINTSVPIAGFFWAAPVILLALYIYLNLYLQRLWEGMASLPAIFPDGRTLDERTHPWLLSGIVRVHVPRLANRPLAQTYLQFWISVIAAWGMVPFTIAMFAWRYLPKHDWIGSIWLFALLTGAMSYGLYTYRLARSTLKGNLSLRAEPEPIPTQKRAWDGFKRLQFNSVITCLAIFALAWTTFAIEVGKIGPERIVVLSSNIYWKLPIEFGHAQMQDADLKNADLSSVDLRRGLLMDANLEKANLSIGDLRETFFTRANLKRANLKFADLRNAFLYDANLEKANLRGAKLGGARLKDANFTGARLKEADLRKSYVTQAQLDTACGDAKTKLPPGLTLKSCKQKPSNR